MRSTIRPASIPRTTRSTSRSCSIRRLLRARLRPQEREPLLAQMADEVAALVLRDNYLQGEALSVAEARGVVALDRQLRMIRDLERAGRLDRALEFLPDDETLAARVGAAPRACPPGTGGAARLRQDDACTRSCSPPTCRTLPELADELRGYFPAALRAAARRTDRHPSAAPRDHRDGRHQRSRQPRRHYLRPRHARAHRPLGARDRASLPDRARRLRAADSVDRDRGARQQGGGAGADRDAARDRRSDRARSRLAALPQAARHRPPRPAGLRRACAASPHLCSSCCRRAIAGSLSRAQPPASPTRACPKRSQPASAERCFSPPRSRSPIWRSARHKQLDRAAQVYYGVGAQFALDEMRTAARRLPAETPWQKQAVEATIDDFFALQTDLAARILASSSSTQTGRSDCRVVGCARGRPRTCRAVAQRAARCCHSRSRNARCRRPPAPPRAGVGYRG